jgi:hypothetical protein
MERRTLSQSGTWAERQIGVYHRFGQATKSNDVMVLLLTGPGKQPFRHLYPREEDARDREPEACTSGDVVQIQLCRPLYMHNTIFATYLQNWRWYLDEHGDHCARLVCHIAAATTPNRQTADLNLRSGGRHRDHRGRQRQCLEFLHPAGAP